VWTAINLELFQKQAIVVESTAPKHITVSRVLYPYTRRLQESFRCFDSFNMFNAQELRRQLYRSRHQNLMHWIQVLSSAQRNAR
jgi:hypothetical protein